jgi:hypothetical protein
MKNKEAYSLEIALPLVLYSFLTKGDNERDKLERSHPPKTQ